MHFQMAYSMLKYSADIIDNDYSIYLTTCHNILKINSNKSIHTNIYKICMFTKAIRNYKASQIVYKLTMKTFCDSWHIK